MGEAAIRLQPDEEADLVAERALSLPEKARALTITDDASLLRAGEFLTGIKALRKEIGETFDPLITKAHSAHKAAIDAKKKVETPVAEAETIVKRGMALYQEAQERIAAQAAEEARKERERLEAEERAREAEERRRLEREAEDRRLAEAAAAEAAGDAETAERILELPPEVVFVPPAAPSFVPPPPPEPVKVAGVSFSEKWEYEVFDERQLPREYTMRDDKKIGAVVRAMKGETKIPGVRVFATKTVAARAR